MTLPKVADSLAGRMEIHHLWPLSQDEILGRKSNFLDILLADGSRFPDKKTEWKDIIPGQQLVAFWKITR